MKREQNQHQLMLEKQLQIIQQQSTAGAATGVKSSHTSSSSPVVAFMTSANSQNHQRQAGGIIGQSKTTTSSSATTKLLLQPNQPAGKTTQNSASQADNSKGQRRKQKLSYSVSVMDAYGIQPNTSNSKKRQNKEVSPLSLLSSHTTSPKTQQLQQQSQLNQNSSIIASTAAVSSFIACGGAYPGSRRTNKYQNSINNSAGRRRDSRSIHTAPHSAGKSNSNNNVASGASTQQKNGKGHQRQKSQGYNTSANANNLLAGLNSFTTAAATPINVLKNYNSSTSFISKRLSAAVGGKRSNAIGGKGGSHNNNQLFTSSNNTRTLDAEGSPHSAGAAVQTRERVARQQNPISQSTTHIGQQNNSRLSPTTQTAQTAATGFSAAPVGQGGVAAHHLKILNSNYQTTATNIIPTTNSSNSKATTTTTGLLGTGQSKQQQTKMKKKQQAPATTHYYSGSNGNNSIILASGGASSGPASSIPSGLVIGLNNAAGGVGIGGGSSSSSTTNAGLNTSSHSKAAAAISSGLSSAAKKKGTGGGGNSTSSSQPGQSSEIMVVTRQQQQQVQSSAASGGPSNLNSHHPKKVNNFILDASAYQSVQPILPSSSVASTSIANLVSAAGQVYAKQQSKQQACHSTKSSVQPHHHKTHSGSGPATTKHASTKSGVSASGQGWKFAERRLSAKVLEGAAGATRKNAANKGSSGNTGSSSNSMQYENLMLQQLIKQQQKIDIEKAATNGGAFKKNLSVISIDHHSAPANLAAAAQSLGQPHMLLNISYNMNNNIDANSAAQFVFHQQPPGPQGTSSAVALIPGASSNQQAQIDPLHQLLVAGGTTSGHHHHPLSSQQQQQIRTIIGLATAGASQDQICVTGTPAPVGLDTQQQQTTGGLISEAAAAAAQYKTQIDAKKQHKSGGVHGNPYHTNVSSSMLGDNVSGGGMMMTYENSIVQAVKQADIKYRGEQSFDQIKKKRRSVNSNGGVPQARSKQLSSNSGRRMAAALGQNTTNKAIISQQPSQHPNSRSTSSKRGNTSKHGSTSHQQQQQHFKGDSSRILGTSGINQQLISSQQQYHQSKKNVQKKSLEQAKLKVKGSYSQPPDLLNQRGGLGHHIAATVPINPSPPAYALPSSISENDRYLLSKLDEALARDLQDKSASQRVAICSKVWSEIIRRQDPVIASLLTKIKQNYEHLIKHQSKQLQQKETVIEQQVSQERDLRRAAEEKAEQLTLEIDQMRTSQKTQEDCILEMKKQIHAYRREIIELSSNKKLLHAGGGGIHHNNHHHNSKSEGRRVPRLDLSKLHNRDSEDPEGHGIVDGEEEESCASIHDALAHMGAAVGLDGEDGKNVTYQQYLKFLNENRFDDQQQKVPQQIDHHPQLLQQQQQQLGEESQESIMRQEELKQRKNKIIQLLNGDISDNEDEEEEEGEGLEDGLEEEEYDQQQILNVREDIEGGVEGRGGSEDFEETDFIDDYTEDNGDHHRLKIKQQNRHAVQVTANDEEEEDGEIGSVMEEQEIDLAAVALMAAKERRKEEGKNKNFQFSQKHQYVDDEDEEEEEEEMIGDDGIQFVDGRGGMREHDDHLHFQDIDTVLLQHNFAEDLEDQEAVIAPVKNSQHHKVGGVGKQDQIRSKSLS